MPFDGQAAAYEVETDAVLSLLENGRERVAKGWCQGTTSRTRVRPKLPELVISMLPMNPDPPSRVTLEYETVEEVCALGALVIPGSVIFIPPPAVTTAIDYLGRALGVVLFPGCPADPLFIAKWNDSVDRRQRDAVRLYDVAIRLRRADLRAQKNGAAPE